MLENIMNLKYKSMIVAKSEKEMQNDCGVYGARLHSLVYTSNFTLTIDNYCCERYFTPLAAVCLLDKNPVLLVNQ